MQAVELTEVPLSSDDLVELVRVVRAAGIDYLEIETPGFRLTLGGDGRPGDTRPGPEVVAEERPVDTEPEPVAPAPVAEPGARSVPEGCVAVPAPMIGVFYRRPEPGAPPFVEVGTSVGAGVTLALVEVMKLFNAVTSPTDGVVESILVDDGELVEYGQPLFAVRAADYQSARK